MIIDNLGLEEYADKARICFFYHSVPKTYLIVYDSLNPRRIITKQLLKNYGTIGVSRDADRLLDFTPPWDLKDFTGNLKGIFITYDIGSAMKLGGHTPYNESVDNEYDHIKFFELKGE